RVFRESPRVSFRALGAAGIDARKCQLVGFWPDGYGDRMYPDAETAKLGEGFNPPDGAITGQETWSDDHGRRVWHRVGSGVLRENGHDYLCSMDEGSYFVSQLYRRVRSVADAFASLNPREVVAAEEAGLEVKRQGEWFFIPVGTPKAAGFRVKDFLRGGYT